MANHAISQNCNYIRKRRYTNLASQIKWPHKFMTLYLYDFSGFINMYLYILTLTISYFVVASHDTCYGTNVFSFNQSLFLEKPVLI